MSSRKTKIYRSFSSRETEAIGEALAKKLSLAKKRSAALVVALKGDLGAGKTTFTQGFFRGLGITKRAQSPTFIIMRRHRATAKNTKKNGIANIFHIDAYRLKKRAQLEALEVDKILSDAKNAVLIEWPEQAKKLLPKSTVHLHFKHGRKENERKIMIKQ